MTPHDPFEHLQNSNPVSPGMEPSAPMSMADRIVGTRAGWPAWAMGMAAAAAVLVVGVVSLLVINRSGDDIVTGSQTTSTTAATTSSVTPTTGYVTTTLGPEDEFEAVVYFLADGVDDTAQSGPYLIPVAVPVSDRHTVAGTMWALLEGPPADVPALSTAIPEGTTVSVGEGPPYADGIVDISLSSAFESGGGSFSVNARLAQVVFSLTRIDGVDGVRFFIDGAPLTVLGGEGIIVPDPMAREDFYPGVGNAWDDGPQTGLVPAILVESPAYGALDVEATQRVGTAATDEERRPVNLIDVAGIANVFEATVVVALTDGDGLIIWEGFTTASCGTGCWGEWAVTIPYRVDEPQMGALIAWEQSMQDGSQINVREHPVWLVPPSGATDTTTPDRACSGSLVDDPLVPQLDLPPEVAATRAAIFDAAVTCDWEALRALAGGELTFTFGAAAQDAISNWQELEASGDAQPMRYLAELLNRSYGTQPGPEDQLYYAWPSAFVVPWQDVTERQREELRPLFGDEDFAVFEGFGGYIGDRIGILSDGTWAYFVAGD
jgi:spore germination protein GerM